jgi:error-prone DNA polymerase
VKTIGTKHADKIVAERDRGGPYVDMADLVRRTGITAPQVEALATAGAFDAATRIRRPALATAVRERGPV